MSQTIPNNFPEYMQHAIKVYGCGHVVVPAGEELPERIKNDCPRCLRIKHDPKIKAEAERRVARREAERKAKGEKKKSNHFVITTKNRS